MIWITHLVAAGLVFLFLKAPLKLPWLALPVCLIAALLPDIDHRNSKISHKMPIASRIANMIFNHRGLIHSLVAAIAFSVLVFFALQMLGVGVMYSYAFFFGYVSHLVIDSLNPTGIAWLRPFTKKRVRSWIRCGGAAEIVLLVGMSGLLFAKIFGVV